jgi:glycosyltransferase involved in cell wall biosynthesis
MIRNRRISIITPVYAPRAEYLGETYKSLEAQEAYAEVSEKF